MAPQLKTRCFVKLALVTALTLIATPAMADWQDVATGVRYQTLTREGAKAYAMAIDLCAPGIRLRATAPGEGPRTTGSFAELTGTFAAINGDWWARDGLNPNLPQTTFPRGLAVGNGKHFPGTEDPTNYGFLAFGPESAVHSRMEEAIGAPQSWMEEVVSGQPTLIWNGQLRDNPAAHCGIKRARTATGMSEDGKTLFWAVVQEVSGSAGMTCNQMASLMKSIGAYSALNQDGGGSSTMWIRGRGTVNAPSDGSPRSVVNHWGVYAPGKGPPRSCPDRGIPSWDEGVRRHVQNPASMTAWRFSGLDIVTVSDAVLAGWPEGEPWPLAPKLVQGAGDPKVYLEDGTDKRHVTSPTSMAHWRFDWAAIAAADVSKLSTEIALPRTPVLVKGSGNALYIVDWAKNGVGEAPGPADPGTDPDTDPDVEDPPDDDPEQGGGCNVSTQPGAPLWGLMLLGLLARRRRLPRGN